jgi:hypothetical protein
MSRADRSIPNDPIAALGRAPVLARVAQPAIKARLEAIMARRDNEIMHILQMD